MECLSPNRRVNDQVSTRRLGLIASAFALALLTACSDVPQSSEPETIVTPVREQLFIEQVGDEGTPGNPVIAIMGQSLGGLRVRVRTEQGHVAAGVRVIFSGSAVGAPVATATDSAGIAELSSVVPPVRDTTAVRLAVVARISPSSSAATTALSTSDSVVISIDARRDLDHFGGVEPFVANTMPLDRASIDFIRPLGALTSFGGLPSPDAEFVEKSVGASGWPVHAIARGLIIGVDRALGVLLLRVRDRIVVRYAGVDIADHLWVGGVVDAGDALGTLHSNAQSGVLALRVLDAALDRRGWVHPERYGTMRNAAFVGTFYTQPLRSELYALVRRNAPDLDGRIEYDRSGRLVGSWFTSPPQASYSVAWSGSAFAELSSTMQQRAVTFAYDAERPGQVRIALGTEVTQLLGVSGLHAVAWEDADPATVSSESGITRYALYDVDDDVRIGAPRASLLVQIVSGDQLRIEAFDGATRPTAFTSRAITLVR